MLGFWGPLSTPSLLPYLCCPLSWPAKAEVHALCTPQLTSPGSCLDSKSGFSPKIDRVQVGVRESDTIVLRARWSCLVAPRRGVPNPQSSTLCWLGNAEKLRGTSPIVGLGSLSERRVWALFSLEPAPKDKERHCTPRAFPRAAFRVGPGQCFLEFWNPRLLAHNHLVHGWLRDVPASDPRAKGRQPNSLAAVKRLPSLAL